MGPEYVHSSKSQMLLTLRVQLFENCCPRDVHLSTGGFCKDGFVRSHGLGEMNDWLSAKDHSTHLLEQQATQHNLGLWVIFLEGGVGGEQPWGF